MSFKKEVVDVIEPRDVFVGNPKAEITLEEFGEYESEECARANEVVKKLLQDFDGKIRFNFRHFPMTRVHQRALKAGEAAVATAQVGKFWEMHNIMFANRRNLGTTSLKLLSKEAGVNNKKFLDELVNATYGWHVQSDIREGLDRGVKTVPTFFINGTLVTGKPTYETLSKAIQDAMKKVGKVKTDKEKKVPAPESVKPVVETKAAAPAPKAPTKVAPKKVAVQPVQAKKTVKPAAKTPKVKAPATKAGTVKKTTGKTPSRQRA